MFRKCFIILLAVLAGALGASADKVVSVSGTARYRGELDESPAVCKRRALEMACTEALGREFGWSVVGQTHQQEVVSGDSEEVYFNATHERTAKGEWVSTTEESYDFEVERDGNLIVTCHVRGTARRPSNEAVDFEARLLCNGTTPTHARSEFRNGDYMYLLFRAPVDGYVAVYLVDDEQQAYTLLPYKNTQAQTVEVKGDREYIFFDRDSHYEGMGTAVSVKPKTNKTVETDDVIVVFSPNPFSKALDKESDSSTIPRVLPFKDLNRWLLNVQKNDPKLSKKTLPLVINGE